VRNLLLAASAALLVAACGTTVPVGSRATTGDGVGGPAPAAEATTSARPLVPGATSGDGVIVSGSSQPVTGSGTGGSAGGSTVGSPTPGARVTSPLTIGLTVNDSSGSSAALGFDDPGTVTAKTIAEALVRGINASGGLAGRRLTAVEQTFNGQDADYSATANRACTDFTQDHKVSVVLDNSFGTIGGFHDCLRKAGVLSITSQDDGDRTVSQGSPLLQGTSYMTFDRTYASVLTGLHATGYLTGANQLGVILESCPQYTRAWTRTLLPLISSLRLKAPKQQALACTTGFASAGPAASAMSNAILAFRRAGVDRVMFVTVNEGTALYLFTSAAESQGFRPGYLLSSWSYVQAVRSSLPAPQQALLHGVGNLPFSDVDAPAATAVDARCQRLAKAGGITAGTGTDRFLISQECGPLLLLEAALTSSNGRSDAATLAAAIASSRAALPGLILGRAGLAGKRDAPDLVQVFAFSASCTCMRYAGQPRPAAS